MSEYCLHEGRNLPAAASLVNNVISLGNVIPVAGIGVLLGLVTMSRVRFIGWTPVNRLLAVQSAASVSTVPLLPFTPWWYIWAVCVGNLTASLVYAAWLRFEIKQKTLTP